LRKSEKDEDDWILEASSGPIPAKKELNLLEMDPGSEILEVPSRK